MRPKSAKVYKRLNLSWIYHCAITLFKEKIKLYISCWHIKANSKIWEYETAHYVKMTSSVFLFASTTIHLMQLDNYDLLPTQSKKNYPMTEDPSLAMWVAWSNAFYNSYVISGQSIRAARRRDARWNSDFNFIHWYNGNWRNVIFSYR